VARASRSRRCRPTESPHPVLEQRGAELELGGPRRKRAELELGGPRGERAELGLGGAGEHFAGGFGWE